MLQPTQLLSELANDLAPELPPLLRGRALCCAARFSGAVAPTALVPFLPAIFRALQPAEALHLRFAAARALKCLCQLTPPALLGPSISEVLPALVALLPEGEEDGALVVLEALNALLPMNLEAAAGAPAGPHLP